MNIDMAALHAIEADKGITVDVVVDTIKSALLTAYRHTEGHEADARIEATPSRKQAAPRPAQADPPEAERWRVLTAASRGAAFAGFGRGNRVRERTHVGHDLVD